MFSTLAQGLPPPSPIWEILDPPLQIQKCAKDLRNKEFSRNGKLVSLSLICPCGMINHGTNKTFLFVFVIKIYDAPGV